MRKKEGQSEARCLRNQNKEKAMPAETVYTHWLISEAASAHFQLKQLSDILRKTSSEQTNFLFSKT